jgi:hypothetical protein
MSCATEEVACQEKQAACGSNMQSSTNSPTKLQHLRLDIDARAALGSEDRAGASRHHDVPIVSLQHVHIHTSCTMLQSEQARQYAAALLQSLGAAAQALNFAQASCNAACLLTRLCHRQCVLQVVPGRWFERVSLLCQLLFLQASPSCSPGPSTPLSAKTKWNAILQRLHTNTAQLLSRKAPAASPRTAAADMPPSPGPEQQQVASPQVLHTCRTADMAAACRTADMAAACRTAVVALSPPLHGCIELADFLHPKLASYVVAMKQRVHVRFHLRLHNLCASAHHESYMPSFKVACS